MIFILSVLTALAGATEEATVEDPFQWLEAVDSDEALDWVRARNAASTGVVTEAPGFTELQQRLLAVYDSKERIPGVGERAGHWYNFWRDDVHPRGVWRRTTRESYTSGDTQWETLLDLDALSAAEDENWVWKGSDCLPPEHTKCLLDLSRGGADATVLREFDLATLSFVEGGFELPESKGGASWIDADTVYVATDFGQGSMTDSGYARIVKRWSRGTPLEDAEVVFEGKQEDVSVGAWRDHTPGFVRDFVYRSMTFYSNEIFLQTPKGLKKIDKQDSANASVWKEWLLLELREAWTVDGTTYPAGSLLVAPFNRWMKGKRTVQALFTPTERSSLAGFSVTKDHLLLNTLEDVKNRIEVLTPGKKSWTRAPMVGLPDNVTVHVSGVDSDTTNAVWVRASGYTTPSTLAWAKDPSTRPDTLRQLPAFFTSDGLAVSQHFATSKDGTKVPYFQVAREDLVLDGTTPTLLYGYGGFEVSLTPGYSAGVGAGWLEKGGVYVVANIRGGGEYGPRWHQAALKENRPRAYEDFAAVGEDLVARGVTAPSKLGIRGGSNGGLLMGNMLTLYPDHWGAVLCQVPLLDMRRYHLLLAGASWMGEYGDPDVAEEWAYIQTWSPYHNVDTTAAYPPVLFTTSTRDDRVHPAHARKMAAKLLDGGEDGVLYYENIEGGHGGAANNKQSSFMEALGYTFLWHTLTTEPVADAEPEAE